MGLERRGCVVRPCLLANWKQEEPRARQSRSMATAEHREPCDSRGSCTVLGAPGVESPPGDSTWTPKIGQHHSSRGSKRDIAATANQGSAFGATSPLPRVTAKVPSPPDLQSFAIVVQTGAGTRARATRLLYARRLGAPAKGDRNARKETGQADNFGCAGNASIADAAAGDRSGGAACACR
jgi:hypothetical protein